MPNISRTVLSGTHLGLGTLQGRESIKIEFTINRDSETKDSDAIDVDVPLE